MVRQRPLRRLTEPDNQSTLLGNGNECVIDCAFTDREPLPVGFPTELFYEQLMEVAVFEKRTRSSKIQWHRSISPNTKRADNLGFARIDGVMGYAQTIFLMKGEDKRDKLFVVDAGFHVAVEKIACCL